MNEKLSLEKQELVNNIIKLMERDNLSFQEMWKDSKTPFNPLTDKKYKGSNNLRLSTSALIQNFKDPRWMTFNQAKEKGYIIKKGAKSTSIYYYQYMDRLTKKPFDVRRIENLAEEEREKYKKENVYSLLKKYNVFNAEQIDGIEKYQDEIDISKRNDILEKILSNSEASIYYDQTEKAFYNLKKDTIHLPGKENFTNIENLYSVALHEMAHSTGHEKRLNRNMEGTFGDKDYAKEELIAEFSSVFMQQEINLKIDDRQLENNAAYIKSWNNVLKENPEILFEAIKEAQKVNDYILEPYRKELESVKILNKAEKNHEIEQSNLKVTLHWSEAMKGEEVNYEGIKAYEFLKKIRDMDKERHAAVSLLTDEQKKSYKGFLYYKTKITFEEKEEKRTKRIDIGDGLFSKDKIWENLKTYGINSEVIRKYEEIKNKTLDKMNTDLGNINLKDLMEYMGETVVPNGKTRYKLKNHDSLVLSGSTYVWNSKSEKGNFYSLLNSLYGMKGKEIYKTVNKFLEDIQKGEYKPSEDISINLKTVSNKTFKRKDDYKKIEEYLVNKRKIDEKIVKTLYKNNLLFLDEKNNINFVIKDMNGKIQGHDVIGTTEARFRKNTSQCYGFNIEDNPERKKETLYIFEAAIDLISYLEMNKEKINERHKEEGVRFLSISGVREDILKSYLTEDVKNLYICTDWDKTGNNFYKMMEKEYKNLNIYRELPELKDWNEDLQIKKEKIYKKEGNEKKDIKKRVDFRNREIYQELEI